ncbi:SAM-dependent methyltransferase [Sandaracinus amylolyticus]|uniref:SAM-dependent methyltransferase n=1 Tax=Sandaracinus amylolyticus TaxID=927083 RepID=A0A0F6VZZ1_9BACT|nr:SAM-dependent methyltransferase [Sandaracinus amylolyticus]
MATSVARHYDARGARALPSDGPAPVVNMGYWRATRAARAARAPTRLHDASLALFDLVLDEAAITPGDRVVDAGCGFGLASLRAIERGAASVIGLNVSRAQLAHARALAENAGHGSRAQFVCASATQMPLEPESAHAVVSIEAAFHFDDRDAFFDEARRVLAPGGRLVIADLVLTPPANVVEAGMLSHLSRALAFPLANAYDLAAYQTRVRRAGLVVESCRSIAHDVLPAFRRWMARNALRHRAIRDDLALAPYLLYPWDYALVVARRPEVA